MSPTKPSYTQMSSTYSGGEAASPPQRRLPPMLTLPPRSTLDTLSIELSPGPMTLVSNFFSDHYPNTDLSSFSQLLPIIATQNPPPFLYHNSLNCEKQLKEDDKQIQQDLDNSKTKAMVSITKPANDGYKWRKYGQKQVKASQLPRTYYRCTDTNCPATKKIGHFLDGDISDIIYKGQHNHDPPPGAAMMNQDNNFVMVANEVASDTINLKKRKPDFGCVDRAVVVVEPKVVVQMTSEVDILEDGFKWRKYGQKVVKGNTFPRNYYRCAYAGCKVKKHVEKVYLDPQSVVTTYQGKHKHDIPVLANPSSHKETNFLFRNN